MPQYKLSAEQIDPLHEKIAIATATDIAALRTQFIALLTKLDANHGVASDHVSTLTPPVLNVVP